MRLTCNEEIVCSIQTGGTKHMKQKFIDLYMDWATRTAQLSHAVRLKVGAIIVKEDRVVSMGYNGMPSGWDNNCEDRVYATEWSIDNCHWEYQEEDGTVYNLKTKPEVLHAERNALDKLAKCGGVGGKNASMFITHAPCIECAKSIYGAGITEVFYGNEYRSKDGIYFLEKCGVTVIKINKSTTC
jgi:dCMP deaminase